MGCHRGTCDLCASNPKKRCTRQLDSRIIVRESLRAPCGAELRLHLFDGSGSEPAQEVSAGLSIKVC